MSYDNTNRGALFRNDKKESDNHPDYKGSINVGGEEYWLSAWLNESQKGTKYFSMSVTKKDAPKEQPKQDTPRNDDFLDQDIPF
jgi:uncharacterized protein (DUF736 family)